MKYKITRKIVVDFTLDSSEAIMFSQGGKSEIVMNVRDFGEYDDVKFTVQIAREDKARYDFITEEGKKHVDSLIDEEKEARKRDNDVEEYNSWNPKISPVKKL